MIRTYSGISAIPRRHRTLLTACLIAAVAIAASTAPTVADVLGRLNITVHSKDNTPISGAQIVLHDTAGVHQDYTLITDAAGAALSAPLENRSWQVMTSAPTFDPDTRTVTVVADVTTNLDISLPYRVVKFLGVTRIIPNAASRISSDTRRDQTFVNRIPATGANPQSLPRLLSTVPGFVASSVNAIHPRGEHASTSIYIDGFLLPGALQGRAGPQISPDIIQNADVITGGYAPEYGSETAAILNLSLRSGTIQPYHELTLDSGGFKTYDQILTVGGQAGSPLSSGGSGDVPRRFRYLVNVNNRSTANALEPPQPDNQAAHNAGRSATLFGNFNYIAGSKDTLSLVVNDAPSNTQIANRTGLPGLYAPIGQGFGYGGARDANGAEAGVIPNQGVVGDQIIPLASQDAAHQDVFQADENGLVNLNYRHTFNSNLTGLLSIGATRARLDIRNNNPSINTNSLNPDGTLSVIDNSIEYNPTVLRNNTQKEIGGSLTLSRSSHTYKAGFIYQAQTGDETYQFIPQSQLALDSLAAVQGGGPQLAPNGAYQTDTSGNPVMDVLGNQVYQMTPGATTPVVSVHRSGYYAAGYLQDSWNVSRQLVINYGARLDSYGQKQTIGNTTSVNEAYLGPRFNLAYLTSPGSTVRLIYDKMFTQPPLAEGAIVGTSLKPETFDHYEASMERQLSPGQTAKVAYYYKNISNQDDTGILIPYTQIGAYTTLQYQHASVHGLEFSYNLTPRYVVGMGGYAAYTRSHAAPGGLNQTGSPAPYVNDHDQRDTLSAGMDYTWKSQAFAGLDFYYGSGEASTVLAPISPSNNNILANGQRHPHKSVNVRVGTGPRLLGSMGLRLDVENIFDDRSVLNFNSGFSGTRFEQGRRVLLSVTGSF